MKRHKWIAAVLALAVIPFFAWAATAQAQHFSRTVASDQVVQGSVYSAGKDVQIRGIIYGDVYCAGPTVVVDATVYGDVICTGSQIIIAGKIEGDVRAAGQAVELRADVTRNVTLAGLGVVISKQATIGQDATIMSSDATIKGSIGRDAVTSGGKVVFEGSIGRNFIANNEAIELQGKGRVIGDLSYTSGKELRTSGDANVAGQTRQQQPPKKAAKRQMNPVFFLLMVIGLTLVVVVLTLLVPRFLQRTSNRLAINFLPALLTGLVASLLLPALTFLLIISAVGIPLILVLLVAVMFSAVLSGPIVAYSLGRFVFSGRKHPALMAAIGGLILSSAYFVPFVGIFVMMLTFFIGFGALLLELKAYAKQGPLEPSAASAKKAASKQKS